MKTVVISPSGKFYGSEQTLFTFLTNTKNKYDVYVNRNDGKFKNLLAKQNKHKIHSFRNPILLYTKLLPHLILGKYKTLYCNEGGHIRYIKTIAKILPKSRFVIHIRLTEDTNGKRIGKSLPNIKLISVSKYIADLVYNNTKIDTQIISSPTREIQEKINWNQNINNQKILRLGIIGRLTPSKGIREMLSFVNYCENKCINNLELHFFGDIEEADKLVNDFLSFANNTKYIHSFFHGFKSKIQIFESIDVVIHFNREEPLGVIFFEALNFGKPFIGFNAGGIGNIAERLEIQNLMLDISSDWEEQLISQITNLYLNIEKYKIAQIKMLKEYSIDKYCENLEFNIIGND